MDGFDFSTLEEMDPSLAEGRGFRALKRGEKTGARGGGVENL